MGSIQHTTHRTQAPPRGNPTNPPKIMKLLSILILTALAVPAMGQFGPRKKPGRPGIGKEAVGKNAALREEQVLDRIDTHQWKKDPEAIDKRPTGLNEYHTRTLRRIVVLLRHGALSEEKGKIFKECHTEITQQGKVLNEDGELDAKERETLRTRPPSEFTTVRNQ